MGLVLVEGKFNTTAPGGFTVTEACPERERLSMLYTPGAKTSVFWRDGTIGGRKRGGVRRSRKDKGSRRRGNVAWELLRVVGARCSGCGVIAADARVRRIRRQAGHSDSTANLRVPCKADASIGTHIAPGIGLSGDIGSAVRGIIAVGCGVAVAAAAEGEGGAGGCGGE
jgi:hypothetical protein